MAHKIKDFFIYIGAFFLIISLSKNLFSYQDKINFYNQYVDDYEKTWEENKTLKSELKKTTDPFYVEKDIREKLQLVKPNEIAVIVPQTTPTPTPKPVIEKTPLEQWKELVER